MGRSLHAGMLLVALVVIASLCEQNSRTMSFSDLSSSRLPRSTDSVDRRFFI